MAAPSTSGNRFRNLSRKINGPAFRVGMGKVYRELERQGKIPAEGIEKKAEYEANKKEQIERLQGLGMRKALLARLKAAGKWFSDLFE